MPNTHSLPEIKAGSKRERWLPAPTYAPRPAGTPLIGDKAYDSEPLHEELAKDRFILIAPHRDKRTTDQRWSSLAAYPTTLDRGRYRRIVTRYEHSIVQVLRSTSTGRTNGQAGVPDH